LNVRLAAALRARYAAGFRAQKKRAIGNAQAGVAIGFASTHAVNGFNPGRRDVQETFLLPKPGR
jgi:hypothetical protein